MQWQERGARVESCLRWGASIGVNEGQTSAGCVETGICARGCQNRVSAHGCQNLRLPVQAPPCFKGWKFPMLLDVRWLFCTDWLFQVLEICPSILDVTGAEASGVAGWMLSHPRADMAQAAGLCSDFVIVGMYSPSQDHLLRLGTILLSWCVVELPRDTRKAILVPNRLCSRCQVMLYGQALDSTTVHIVHFSEGMSSTYLTFECSNVLFTWS